MVLHVYGGTVWDLYWHPLTQEAREMGLLQGFHSHLTEKVNHVSRGAISTTAKSMDWLQDVQSSQEFIRELQIRTYTGSSSVV